MFEHEIEKDTEQPRSRAILWVGAVAALLITVLVIMVVRTRTQHKAELDSFIRSGSAEFEAYKNKVELEVTDKIVHPNMVGMFQLEVRARMHNRGDRALAAVEVLGKMLDLSDKIIATNISKPIPRIRTEPLKPGESFLFSVKVDAPGKVSENDVKDITIELQGLRFK